MAMALRRIDSNHFSDSWFSKIKTTVPSDNKHLKATNLRKILVAIVDFNDIVPFVSLPDFGQPNVNLAAEGQPEEIGKENQKMYFYLHTYVFSFFREWHTNYSAWDLTYLYIST